MAFSSSSRKKQTRPSDKEILGDGFSRGAKRLSFAQIVERNPARFRSDQTVLGYQNRILYEIPNFSGLAQSFGRLREYAQDSYREAARARLLRDANRYRDERDRRRFQEWNNRIRTNILARVLGLAPHFVPEEPPGYEEEWWRISKLREWYADTIKRRTPTPYCEVRVYVYTRKPDDPVYRDASLEDALDSIEVWLTTGLASYPINRAEEREEVDEDELEQENMHQRRSGGRLIREDEVWYYIAFWKMPDLTQPDFEYYGRVFYRAGTWSAEEPREFKGRKPDFGTPFTAYWRPPARGR